MKFSIKRFNLYKLYLKGSMYKQHFESIYISIVFLLTNVKSCGGENVFFIIEGFPL